jgi:alpha-L-rhamnosidase
VHIGAAMVTGWRRPRRMNESAPFRAALSQRAVHAWSAAMVHPEADMGVGTRSSFLRKSFDLDDVSGNEVLRISALGLYRCFINGERVGQDLLTPGWTSYDKRLSYQTYPVGRLLRPGRNTIDIWLADGWLRSQMMWAKNAIYNTWGDKLAAIAELAAGPESGARVLVKTDASWSSGLTPILKSGIYFGEIYDARETPVADQGSTVLPFDISLLIPHETDAVHELTPLRPIAEWRDDDNRTIYDFGQNSGGYVAFTVRGEAGARITVEHSEIIDRDNQFDNRNYRTAAARLEYVLAGNGDEHYRPVFTFQGFRYARIRIDGKAEIVAIESVPISSAQVPAGSFTCGHPLVNRLVENTIWSQRANFIEVPTDCPQRDERLGWTGDAQVFAPPPAISTTAKPSGGNGCAT